MFRKVTEEGIMTSPMKTLPGVTSFQATVKRKLHDISTTLADIEHC